MARVAEENRKELVGLVGRHALVTGGARGIGLAVAKRLAGAGANVTLLGRDQARLEAAAREMPGARTAVADVTEAQGLERAITQAVAGRGTVSILVNNAGAAESAPFLKSDDELWMRMLDVNLMGAVRATRSVLPAMREAGYGRIVNIASTAGLKGYGYVSAYCAAKHAVVGFTRSLAVEIARTGITVNAVCPGYTDTDLVAASVARIHATTGRSEDEILAEMVKDNPMQRLIEPDEVAEAVLWLTQPRSGAITGMAVPVAGGEVT